MGCDIHMYVQYREKDRKGTKHDWWTGFADQINPGRDYSMFGILAGVRNVTGKSFEPKGMPSDESLSYSVNYDQCIYIDEDSTIDDNYCTLEKAQSWGVKSIIVMMGDL